MRVLLQYITFIQQHRDVIISIWLHAELVLKIPTFCIIVIRYTVKFYNTHMHIVLAKFSITM